MKKVISVILVLFISLCAFSGCGGASDKSSDKLSVVVTIFPEYDWVSNIAGDTADITLLLDNGVDLHSYQPTAQDIVKISSCDLFIYVGGESDEWAEDIIASQHVKNTLNLLDVLGENAKKEEPVNGVAAEEEEDEYDEHVWLSIKNAKRICRAITDKLAELSPENEAIYKQSLSEYTDKLSALDAKFTDMAANVTNKTLLFADRFPFRYFADDYGLDYFAAFSGCSAESEASFETVKFLADTVDELQLPAILILEGSDGKIAQTVASTSQSKDIKILKVDSMQSTTSDDMKNGETYIKIMENNLAVFTEALG